MRVVEELLRPGVQDGGDGDLGAQAAEGDLRQGLGDRGEEEIIGHAGSGQEKGMKLRGDGEDDMEVGHRQQLGFPFGQPPGTGRSLTLRTTAVRT